MIFGRRKHQAARDRAAAMVRDAAAAGRITTLDRDRRLQELEYAGTAEEIESFVRDLRLPVDPPAPWPPAVDPGPAAGSDSSGSTGRFPGAPGPGLPATPYVAPGARPPWPAAPARPGAQPAAGDQAASAPGAPGGFGPPSAPGAQSAHGRATGPGRTTGPGGSDFPPSQPPGFAQRSFSGPGQSTEAVSGPPAGHPSPAGEAGRSGPAPPFDGGLHPQSSGGTLTHALREERRNPGCLVAAILAGFLFTAAPLVGVVAIFWASDRDAAPDFPAEVERERTTASNFGSTGWQALIAAFEAETGSDRVSAAIVYDDWAVVTASEESGGFSYHFDGETLERTSDLEMGFGDFSLRDVEMAGLRAGLERAERGVGELRNRYLHIWQREQDDGPSAVGHVLGTDANHTVHLDLAGEILHCDC